jgi:hypothetical protein
LPLRRNSLEEQEGLNQEEKEQLTRSIETLVRETPEAPVVGSRFKRLVKKAGGAAAEARLRAAPKSVLGQDE